MAIITAHPGQPLQTLHDAASAGDILQLTPGVYPGTLSITKSLRIVADTPMPDRPTGPTSVVLTSSGQTVTNHADTVMLDGLTLNSSSPDATILTDLGSNLYVDHCAILGTPTGQHRGIQVHGRDAVIIDTLVDGCWLVGRDAQAICGWDGTDGLLIDRCWLAGGAETILFGGADSTAPDRMPKNITIRHSTLTKHKEWYAGNAQIKCALELKCAQHVVVSDCVLEYAGIKGGSTGFVILLTPRNQGGKAPWSEVTDVRIERCTARFGSGGVSLLGMDDTNPSGPLDGVTLTNLAVTDLDPTSPLYGGGHGWVIYCNNGPGHLRVDGFTGTGIKLAASMYFEKKAPRAMVLRNLHIPLTKYGFMVSGATGGMGIAAVETYAPDAVVLLTPTDPGASHTPA